MCGIEKELTALTRATVSLNEPVARETFRMVLAADDWRGEEPDPGQFLMLQVCKDTDPLLSRPFGISGFARKGAGAEIEIIYRVVGRGTGMMSEWHAGRPSVFLGPLGNGFALPPEGSSSLLITGGVGLPPLLALARKMVSIGRGTELSLLYGDTSRDRLMDLGPEILRGVRIVTCTEDGSCGTPGMVTGLLEAEDMGEGCHIFVCGPNAMMNAVMELTAGRPLSAQYSMEARMACGFGVCSGCAVKTASDDYLRVCREGPVFDGADLSHESFREV